MKEAHPERVPDDVAGILVAIAATAWKDRSFGTSVKYGRQAIEVYRERQDGRGLAISVVALFEIPAMFDSPEIGDLCEEALRLLGDGSPELEARVLAILCETVFLHEPRRVQPADPLWLRATRLAERHDFPRLNGALADARGTAARFRQDFAAVRQAHLEGHRQMLRSGTYQMAAMHSWMGALGYLSAGEFDCAGAALREARDFAARHHSSWIQVECDRSLARIGLLRNDASAVGSPAAADAFFLKLVLGETSGDPMAIFDDLQTWVLDARSSGLFASTAMLYEAHLARLWLAVGRHEEACEAFEYWAATNRLLDGWDPHFSLSAIESADETLVALGDEATRRLCYDRLVFFPAFRLGAFMGWGLDAIRGDLARSLGLPAEARHWYEVGIAWATRERCPILVGRCDEGLGLLAMDGGDAAGAREHFDRAIAAFATCGAPNFAERASVRKAGVGHPGKRASYPARLSEREVEVLRLVAEGMTNAQIAAALVVSRATVASHVRAILNKTGCPNRSAAARWFATSGLA